MFAPAALSHLTGIFRWIVNIEFAVRIRMSGADPMKRIAVFSFIPLPAISAAAWGSLQAYQ